MLLRRCHYFSLSFVTRSGIRGGPLNSVFFVHTVLTNSGDARPFFRPTLYPISVVSSYSLFVNWDVQRHPRRRKMRHGNPQRGGTKCCKTYLQASLIPKFSQEWCPQTRVKMGWGQKGAEIGEERLRHSCRGMNAPVWECRCHLICQTTTSWLWRCHFANQVASCTRFRDSF